MEKRDKDLVCIMSIKPKYYNKIISNEKKVEYRKVVPKHTDTIFLYVSSPIKKICAVVYVKDVICGSAEAVWTETENIGGIAKDEYMQYCSNNNIVYALIIKEVKEILPIKLSDLDNFIAPQNYRYYPYEKFSNLVQEKRK